MTLTHDARQSPTAGHPHSVAVPGIALVAAEIPLAVGASAVAWDSSLLIHQLVGTPRDLTARHGMVTFVTDATIVVVPLLAALAWYAARRTGRLWVLGLVVAPVMGWWIEHGHRWFHLTGGHGFRVTEAVGMALAVLPVLLATLACWALDMREQRRRYDEGPPPQLR